MKYLFMVLLLFSGKLMAQQEKFAGDITTTEPQCPPGLCPVVSFSLDVLNFHKPRTSCSSGFGFCIRFSTSVSCEYCRWKTSIDNGLVHAAMTVSGSTAVWHLPLSLKEEKTFEGTDWSTFEVEEGSITIDLGNGKKAFVKGGVYPVFEEGDELVISLNLY